VLLPLAMLFNRTMMAAVLTFAIASSLLAISGGSFVGSTLAFKTLSNDKTNSQLQSTDGSGDSNGSTGDTTGVSAKDLKSLSKCQSDAAADGDLTSSEVADCYGQVF
jgi:hypothetical protein